MSNTTAENRQTRCPNWCEQKQQGVGPDSGGVTHACTAARSSWGEILIKQVTSADGIEQQSPLFIYVPSDPNAGELDTTAAREVGRALLDAADRLEQMRAAA